MVSVQYALSNAETLISKNGRLTSMHTGCTWLHSPKGHVLNFNMALPFVCFDSGWKCIGTALSVIVVAMLFLKLLKLADELNPKKRTPKAVERRELKKFFPG